MLNLLLVTHYSLSFTSVWLWVIALTFVATVAATVFYYRRTNPMLTRGFRIVLGVLRGLALAALFFVFAEPLLIVEDAETKPATVAVLVDNSTSLSHNRHSAEQFAQIPAILQGIKSKLPAGVEIAQYAFADTIKRDGAIDGSFPVTAIGNALNYLKKDLAESNLQGVILLSDGVSNLGANPVTESRSLGVPVTTLGFGDPNPLPDIRVSQISCNPVGFVGKEFPMEITIESRGFENLRLPIRIRQGQRVLVSKEIDLEGQGRQQKVSLAFLPDKEGEVILEASAPVQSNEESEKNNSRQVSVRIRASQIKILLASAQLNWDYKFLHRALAAKQDFKIDQSIDSPQRITGTVPFPETVDALDNYDALILIDFDADWFANRKQQLDAFFERTGKGLFFLAGENFGAHPKTRLQADLLPYQPAAGNTSIIRQEVQFTLTERGRIHPLMRLAEDGAAAQRLLNDLPPFAGYIRSSAAAANATVIASVPGVIPGDTESPIMAVHRYRNGKIAMMSAFPFWRVDFLAKSIKETDSTYNKLIDNMVLWLIAREDVERVTITPERPIFIAGESVRLNARVLDDSYVPVEDAEVEATLRSRQNPADSQIVNFRYDRPGNYSADLHYLPSGEYDVSGRVKREGVSIAKPQASFIVEPYSLEDLSQTANFDALKRISEVSGGQFYAIDDTASITQFAGFEPKTFVRRSELTLFDNKFLLVFIILMLCTEWFLRKRYQLL